MLLDQISIHSWIQSNQIKTETGQLLDFHTHRYLFDIYRDNSKYLCCLKAGQIGFSTMAILKTIWLSRNQHVDIGYVLPTVEMVEKFVGSKVNRMAQQNPIIQTWMKDKDSITQKQIDEHYIFYLGAQTERSAIMLSLDMLVADEYDKAPQGVLETYDSRLQHSKFGYKWVFSNPTKPDYGVDRFWAISDQKKWHITHLGRLTPDKNGNIAFSGIDQLPSGACRKTYIMDESCINYDIKKYICPYCKGEIGLEDIRMGEWKATAQGEWSGYWIPLWINPMIECKVICAHKKSKTKEYFYNFVAGLPYVNANDMLSQQVLESNLDSNVNRQEGRTVIGLDTGHNLHYTLMNQQGVYFHGYCKSVEENPVKDYDPYDEIDKLLENNKTWILVSDQGGDLIGIRKLAEKYKGRVYLCWFTKETKTQELIRWVDYEDGKRIFKVLVDRNRAIQLAVDQLNEKRFSFNGTIEDWQPFFNHALNIYRVKEIQGQDENDPQYNWRWVWKRKGPDHFFMSWIYALVGMDRYGQGDPMVIGRDKFMSGVEIGSSETGVITPARIGIKREHYTVDF